ncbi:MAG: alpha-L-fucosidase [Bacteroidetes bacterium]|nr:alpha-L-fucosidase [Bacteroidota bacterium]
MKRKALYTLAFLLFTHFFTTPLWSQSQINDRAEWFVDARFGMFIHWGVYSGAEGIWKGEKLRNDNDYAEWIYYRNRIEKEEYLTLLDRFDWESINPEEWVLLAKKAGMKYVTITSKHHDGFALWDSKVSDYDVAHYTNPKRDIIKELAVACKKHGLKLGLYYSHWVDWDHAFGWDHTREIYKITPEQYDQYWQEKVMPQMRELLTNYGPIGMMWFDMWVHHSSTIVTKEQLLQLKGLIRELQPDCLVNSRLGLSIKEDSDVDFHTLGDNQLGSRKLDHPWQTPATVAHSWGYHVLDTKWKSSTTLLKSLINNVSLNGNFMLNIGPRGDGSVPYEISNRLIEIGKWLEVNGESVYESEAFDLKKDLHDWGRITYKPSENGTHKLYLHVYNWPYNKLLNLTGITSKPLKVYTLNDKLKSPLPFSHNEVLTEIDLPVVQPDPYVSVLVVEYEKKPEVVENLVAKTVDGGYSLTPQNTLSEEGDKQLIKLGRRGTVPEHLLVNNEYQCKWKIFIDAPCKMNLDVSYSFQGEKTKGTISIQAAGSISTHKVQSTGKTVGEPNGNWHIDNFRSHNAGSIEFPEKGVYEISMKIEAKKDNPVQFQWLWVKAK